MLFEAMATLERAPRQPEVPLSGTFAEFRIALREEIEAARRSAAASGVQLFDGRRIGQAAGAFQYVFRVESALNLPDDSPGDLHVAGRPPLETTIVAINGLEITVSVGEDLGDFVPRATLQSNLTHLLRTLIQRVEGFADRPNPAGERLLGEAEPARRVLSGWRVESLNTQQAEAVASAIARDTTFIWGPPGTGKTSTIGKIGEQLARVGRSVLIVSHTNAAVDQALLAVATELGDDLEPGSVLRLGDPHDQRLLESEHLQAETHIRERSRELLERKATLEADRSTKTSELADVRRLSAIADWVAQSAGEVADLRELAAEHQGVVENAAEAQAEASRLRASVEADLAVANSARELQRRSQEAEPTREELERREALLAPAEARLHEAERLAQDASELYEEIAAMNGVMRRLRRLPSLPEQERTLAEHRAIHTAALDERDQVVRRLAEVREPLLELEEDIKEFEAKAGLALDAVLGDAEEAEGAARRAEREAVDLQTKVAELSGRLEGKLRERVAQLRQWDLIDVAPGTGTDDALSAIDRAASKAHDTLAGSTPATLREEARHLAGELRAIAAEIEEIDEALAAVEAYVIRQAVVVATTLTRAYKRESIQARRFDTVVLDEASMAPIPALWVVAGLADANVVVVGDPMQLPPIKHSEHELAEKWLGQDVFRVSGVQGAWAAGHPPEHLVQLQVQYRMNPEISAIPNALVYDHTLSDDESVRDDAELGRWYDRDWGHDAPVLLVDTGPLNAWVTSVKTGRVGGSRLNFLSATVSVDLAERLLLAGRPELPLGARPRVLIAAPYRPQARLVSRLISDGGLDREVVPGTAHTFQGSEAPVVIFDFVLDEPHRQAGLFDPRRNEDNLRLLNVALTRARRRLVLLGDFAWIERHANRQASLRKLVGFLAAQYPRVSALDVVTAGLHARAAEAHRLILSGQDAPASGRIVVTQEHFFPLLLGDLHAAEERVVIYSPFVTPDRVAMLEPHLRAANDRGVRLYLITKTVEERPAGQQETSRSIEAALSKWGVTVLHKFHMHEKLVLIDGDKLWSGSLNALSFSDTQEVMERRVNRDVLDDYVRVLRLDALLEAHQQREDRCPVCGGELVAAEARNGDPFYWRCLVPDCYTRSLDRPAPRDGLLPCASCGGPVEFRQMPSGPHWRCKKNNRHRQRVAASHLRLPKMRELIPKREIARLERLFASSLAGEQLGLLT